jgi:trehalose synthase-fused probable maltokinase
MAASPDRRARATARVVEDTAPLSTTWLALQRWFGGKARTIDRLRVADVVWLGHDRDSRAIVILDVHYRHDRRGEPVERYALLAAIAESSPAVTELSTDAASIRTVLRALVAGAHAPGVRGGEIVAADVTDAARRDLGDGAAESISVKPLGFEQSNTSLRIGRGYVLKLIRRLHQGENPQLEIGRFLARVGFRFAPPLHGSLTYRGRDGGHSSVAALEGWVDNAGDGWRYVLDALERGAIPSLTADLARLGAITAAFHVALASDAHDEAFAPEPVSSTEARQWRDAVAADAARLLEIVEHDQPHWPAEAAALGRMLLDRREHVAARLDALDLTGGLAPMRKIRVHGDFHLGQTLKTSDGFVLIDFEGEPARPLAERRQKHCALKDVAGLLRSLDYAEATASRRSPAAAGAAVILSQAFLDGYYTEPHLGSFLPRDREQSAAILTLFELEKALYEVEYELNNRPDWLHIPLAAVVRALDAPT